MSYLISNDYLMHHGVKGMKWGVRHDKPSNGTRSSASYRSSSKKNNKNKRLKLSGKTKALIALTGVAVGASVFLYASKIGKVKCDDIMRAGTKLQTLHHHTELVTEGKKFYTTNKALDKIKYRGGFGVNHLGIKKQVTATVQNNIKIAGGDTGRKTMVDLAKSDKQFARYLEDHYGAFNATDMTKKEAKSVYYDFNRRGLLGKSDGEAEKFINALKDKGYGGVADLNDRMNWNTSANILFDNKNIGDIKIRQMTESDIAKARIQEVLIETGDAVATSYTPYVAVGAGFAAGAGIAEDRTINKRIQQNQRKKAQTR